MTFDFPMTSVILLVSKTQTAVVLLTAGIMAKKSSKGREWTKADVRELKTIARHKTPAPKVANALKRTLATPEKGPTSVSLSEIRKAVRAVDGTF
jgi:hypothetical protein